MPPSSKRWDIAPLLPIRQRDRLGHLNPLLAQVLFNRGVTDPVEVDALPPPGSFYSCQIIV